MSSEDAKPLREQALELRRDLHAPPRDRQAPLRPTATRPQAHRDRHLADWGGVSQLARDVSAEAHVHDLDLRRADVPSVVARVLPTPLLVFFRVRMLPELRVVLQHFIGAFGTELRCLHAIRTRAIEPAGGPERPTCCRSSSLPATPYRPRPWRAVPHPLLRILHVDGAHVSVDHPAASWSELLAQATAKIQSNQDQHRLGNMAWATRRGAPSITRTSITECMTAGLRKRPEDIHAPW